MKVFLPGVHFVPSLASLVDGRKSCGMLSVSRGNPAPMESLITWHFPREHLQKGPLEQLAVSAPRWLSVGPVGGMCPQRILEIL